MDPYEILGVSRNASKEEIRNAYKHLAKQYHPDQYQNNPLSQLAEEKFKEINEAYNMLMNDEHSSYQTQQNSGSYSGNYNNSP
jgi:molecular chaperone DnaJ